MSQPTPLPGIPRLLETKRIYLRPFESTDVDTYFPGLFDAEMPCTTIINIMMRFR